MNKIQSNDLNIIVNIQYGVGFELIEGSVEIETTIFNKPQKTRGVQANRKRLNFYEEFIWKIDKDTLKYCRTSNEIVKIECFTTPDNCYGSIIRRQRIGHLIIKLKEFEIISQDWNQSISIRCLKLQGSSSSNNYELRVILIIQEDTDLEMCCNKLSKTMKIDSKKYNFSNEKQSLELDKQGPNKNKSGSRYSKNKENTNKYQLQKEPNEKNEKEINQLSRSLEKQQLLCQETLNKYQDLLNHIDPKDNKYIIESWKREAPNELMSKKKKVDQFIKESRDSTRVNVLDECKLSELISSCLKCTEKSSKIMKKIKKELDADNTEKYPSSSITNSSTQSENDLEIPFVIVQEIYKKLNELTVYMINRNEKIKNEKNKRSQEIINLKNTNFKFSELCKTLAKKVNDEDK